MPWWVQRLVFVRRISTAGYAVLGLGASLATLLIVRALASELSSNTLPVPVDQLVQVFEYDLTGRAGRSLVLPGSLDDWCLRCRQSAQFAGSTGVSERVALRFRNKRCSVHVAGVSDNYFQVLGFRPVAGRWHSKELQKGRAEAVISRSLWQDELGSGDVVGNVLRLEGGVDYSIVGIAPDSAGVLAPADVWLLLAYGERRGDRRCLHVIGRLNPGVSLVEINREVALASRAAAQEHPNTNFGWVPVVEPLAVARAREQRDGLLKALVTMVCAVGLATALSIRLRE